MLASLCPCCFKHPTEPPQDNRVSGKDNTNKNSGQNADNSKETSDKSQPEKRPDPKAVNVDPPTETSICTEVTLKQGNGDGRPQISDSIAQGSNEQQNGDFKKEINNNQSQAKKQGGINKVDQYTEPRIPHGRGEKQQKGVHNDANQQDTRPDSSRTSTNSIGQTRQQNGVKEEDIRKDDKNTVNVGPNSTGTTQDQQKGTQKQEDDNNKVSRQENTNKNTRQNTKNSNPTVMAKSSNPQGREANSKDDFRPDKRPDPPTKTGQEVDQQYGNVKQENSSGGLRDKRPDPAVTTGSSPEAGHLLSKEQQHGFVKQENNSGGLGDKRPDPLKITVTSPEGLQPLSEERKKCDLKQEIQAMQILNTAEQTGQSSVKEKQKDIVSPGPGGFNKDDKYTEHSNPFETTQARASQASEEQRKGAHKQESNANQRDRKLDTTRNSVGQGGKLLTNDQQKGVNQQGIRKDEKNTGPNSTEDKTKNSTEPATKEQHKGTQKQDDSHKSHKDTRTKLNLTTTHYR